MKNQRLKEQYHFWQDLAGIICKWRGLINLTFHIVFLTGFALTLSAQAVSQEFMESLIDEDRILSSPIELHLTSADTPIMNSTVSLNHPDAWLFFDNIKPSDVISNHLTGIMINGSQIVNGVNARIAIYSHGTAIMPHGSSFTPLTIFSGEGFEGVSRELSLHQYHNNLGELDNAIKSFKLKRGYMATFANNADGSGYSRVFIADGEDVEFSVMPEKLLGTVSFIRVFKHQWVNKKGKAGWNPHDLNATSYYDWNIGGNSSADVEYVLIRQNAGWPSWNDINAKRDVSHLLGFNEPDQSDQANMTFQQMIDIWPSMMHSGLRIGAPAWANPWNGNGGNLFDFINKCDELNYRVDFVPVHCYWGGKSPIGWYNDLKHIHDQTGRPLWITEWNNGANWTNEWWPDSDHSYTEANAQKQLNDIKGILQVLDTASFIERYFIYDWVQDCRAMVLNGALTKAGEYYTDNQSQLAYNSKYEVIPHWNYQNPLLSLRYLTLSNSIRLSWDDQNGELSSEYYLEKRVNNGVVDTIYSSDDLSISHFLDPFDAEVGGTITYSLKLRTREGELLESNEVSFYQTSGTENLQTSEFRVKNADWNIAMFSEPFPESPVMILGIPSFNNVFPLTWRVNSVSNSRFMFHLEPWAYLNQPSFNKTDFVAALSLLPGSYDFGGLEAEANAVTGVSKEWMSIQFDQPFTDPPIVFSSIVSASNTYPLTPAVRNVNESGFEIRVKCEESYKGLIFPETIHYLAIEPGKGDIDGKRITVDRTGDGTGLRSTPMELVYDSSYSEPAFFACLQSDEDNFASVVRYSRKDEHTVDLFKQREFSAGISTMNEDQVGWMVMDLAAGQTIGTTSNSLPTLQSIKIYPNPVMDILHIDLNQPTRIEIYDIAGRRQMETEVIKEININALPAGIYLLKAAGTKPERFIKIR